MTALKWLIDVGDELRRVRTNKAATAQSVAKQLKIAPATYSQLEYGLLTPEKSLELFNQLAELGYPVNTDSSDEEMNLSEAKKYRKKLRKQYDEDEERWSIAFSTLLQIEMEQNGLSRAEAAEKMGVSTNTLSSIRTGRVNVSRRKASDFGKSLGNKRLEDFARAEVSEKQLSSLYIELVRVQRSSVSEKKGWKVDWKDRLSQIMDKYEISYKEIAKELGCTYQYIAQVFFGLSLSKSKAKEIEEAVMRIAESTEFEDVEEEGEEEAPEEEEEDDDNLEEEDEDLLEDDEIDYEEDDLEDDGDDEEEAEELLH